MTDTLNYVSPSGSTVSVTPLGVDRWPNRDAERHSFNVQGSSGTSESLRVVFVSPQLIDMALQQSGQGPFHKDARESVARLAVVASADQIATLPQDQEGFRYVEMEGPEIIALLTRPKASDRDLRRYIARRLYDSYARSTLDTEVVLGLFDQQLLGVKNIDFLRNAQVLAEEGYLHINHTTSGKYGMIPTARLVREVERYGAAAEDAITERDYSAALAAYPALSQLAPNLILEYQRYTAARTETELESVFRAVAPLVEAVAKQLLQAHGSKQQHSSLGPVIAEIKARSLDGIAILSQLNHVLKFGRDLAEHGASMPLPVLRIACENAFELVPQLGALFPRTR